MNAIEIVIIFRSGYRFIRRNGYGLSSLSGLFRGISSTNHRHRRFFFLFIEVIALDRFFVGNHRVMTTKAIRNACLESFERHIAIAISTSIDVVIACIEIQVVIQCQVHARFPHGCFFGAQSTFSVYIHHFVDGLASHYADLQNVIGHFAIQENTSREIFHRNAIPTAKSSYLRMERIERIDFIHISIGMIGMKSGVLVLSSPLISDTIGSAA